MSLVKRVLSSFSLKEVLYVFVLFLVFEVLRTLSNNLMYFLFDHTFLGGMISDTFHYNHSGKLLGCKQVALMTKNMADYSSFQRNGLFYAPYLPSVIAFLFLIRKKTISKFVFWVLIIVCCFSVLKSIIEIQYLFYITPDFTSPKYIRAFFFSILFIVMGIYILLKKMDRKDRLMTLLVAFPAFMVGSYVWYGWIGPKILPIII